MLMVSRVTPEGVFVVQGVFPLVDTHGIPLDLVLDRLKDHNMMPDWLDFYQSAISCGWKPSGVMAKLTESIGDVYGTAFREDWTQAFLKRIRRDTDPL